jgi:hypothetical protein
MSKKKDKLNFQNVNKHGKHMEIGFSVLQIRVATAQDPPHFLDKKFLHRIITACVIQYNMERSGPSIQV